MRILLIDDDQDICQLTAKVLTKNGYIVDAFYDAKTAVKHARENKPDLILMDVMLPGLTGPEIVKLLQGDYQFKDVPVIFLTGLVSGDDEESDEGMVVGGMRYQTLGKPYEIEKLLAMVKIHDQ